MTDTPTIYTAHDVPDLINALPTLFGFRPSESLVAVATRGPRRRFGFRMRVDIPPARHVDETAQLIVRHLRNQGAEGAILVAVTEKQEVARALLAAIEKYLVEIELVTAARADGSRYWVDVPHFPIDGIAYEISDHHLSIVQAVAAGQQILPDREALAQRYAPVQEPRRTWLRRATVTVLDTVIPVVERSPNRSIAELGMAELRPILDRGLTGEPLTDDDLVRLAVWACRVEVRDAILGRMSRDNSHDMLRIFTRLAQNVVPPCEPAALTLAAFAAWLTGDGAQSLIAVERALAADPCYSLARTMLALLENGVSPDCWGTFGAEDALAP